MATRKFTLRKNGTRMCTVRITHHFGRADLIWYVYNAAHLDTEAERAAMTRADAMAAAIDRLTYFGQEACYDYGNDDEFTEAHAAAIVDRLFPELIAKV